MAPTKGPVKLAAIPPEMLEGRGNDRLHLGGSVRKAGWQVLDALAGEHVDFVGDMRDLSRFADASFDMVYASHVIEHLGYMKELHEVLGAIARILRPKGLFFVSVPDLDTLARLFTRPDMSDRDRYAIMRMMFGGQINAYDYHYAGLYDTLLASHLSRAGFSEIYHVPELGIFDDTSKLRFGGVLISLNVVAVR
jgi:predicted SAM-dependent methyltransferase